MKKQLKLNIQNLHKRFGTKKVLQGFNLELEQGKSLVIIGGSGSGKSVLLKSILGLIKPDQGKILLDGDDILTLNHRQRMKSMNQFGMLFQGGALFDSLNVWQNIAFRLLNVDHFSKEKAYKMAVNALKKVNLSEQTAHLFPAELSGGMQKRVGLARAIITKPSLIFFDEPTTGLDPITANVINELIIQQVKALGSTAITITHDMISAKTIADEIAMIYQGKLIWKGQTDQIEKSQNPYVDQFIHGRIKILS